jgi:ParB-like nuclease domain
LIGAGRKWLVYGHAETVPQSDVPAEDGLRIEYWPIDRLVPSARNARTHSAAQVAEIAGSIRAFGFTNPLLVGEEADVVAGHGRLAAARLLGLLEVPVIPLRNLNETERRQLMLADNRIALNAGWNAEMLKLELADLGKLGADLKILGFNEQELAAALGGAAPGLVHEDEVPKLGETAVSKQGDIWLLGPHRIGCGDSTEATVVSAVLAGALPQLMVTDPPYGVEYDPAWRHRRGRQQLGQEG